MVEIDRTHNLILSRLTWRRVLRRYDGERTMLSISETTWSQLVEKNALLAMQGYVEEGVFATGIGPKYRDGGLLYVGKSAGSHGTAVGSGIDQARSSAASTAWMVGRCHNSPFWKMADLVDVTRLTIAWTNIAKMDVKGGNGAPPDESKLFDQISEPSIEALRQEIEFLKPGVILFATSGYCNRWVRPFLHRAGYTLETTLDDGHTTILAKAGGEAAILTRHPQGWQREPRNRVAELARSMLGNPNRPIAA